MKVLNYIVCSTIILIGIVLLFSGEFITALAGVVYIVFNLVLTTFSWYENMWKNYLKTNDEINKYFGLE